MDSRPTNLKASNSQQLSNENDIYQNYTNNTIYDEIQKFDFLQEIALNYHTKSNTLKTQLLLEDENVQNQNTKFFIAMPSLCNSLLPMEQAMQLPSAISRNHEDTTLHCFEDHSNATTNMNFDQLDYANLDTILIEMLNNDSKQKFKRTAYTRNALYITNSLNKSLFNEGPATKKIRTPLFNSPISTSHQSITNTRAPSPLKTSVLQQIHTISPLDTNVPLLLPISHEFQFQHVNESTLQTNSFPFISPTNQNEDLTNVDNVLASFENSKNDYGNKDININNLSPHTPILDDYNNEGNLNIHDAISQFSIPPKFSSDQNVNLTNIPTYAIANDVSFEFEDPKEFPNIQNLNVNLMDISYLMDFETKNLDNQYSDTFHTIDPLLYKEQIRQLKSSEDVNDKNNFERASNVMALQTNIDSSTNSKVPPQGPNEASTSCDTNDTNVNTSYILNDNNTSLVSTNLMWHDTQEISEIAFEEINELQNQSFVDMIIDAIEEPIEKLSEIQVEPFVESIHGDTMEKVQNAKIRRFGLLKNPIGVHKIREHAWQATLPKLGPKNELWRIGLYATAEAAGRVRDLVALKLKIHEKVENFTFNFPISNYNDDLEEMQKWSEDDYIWSFKRQAIGFTQSQSGFKCVHRMRQKKSSTGEERWEGRVNNQKGNKMIKGFNKNVIVDQNVVKEIPAIFTDLVNLHLNGWEYVTNFRCGHYTKDDVQKFIALLEENKVYEAYDWDLIKQILKEPLPSNIYKSNSQKIIGSNIVNVENANLPSNNMNESLLESISIKPCAINVENTHVPNNNLNKSSQKSNLQNPITKTFITKLNPKDMAKHFIECPWANIGALWALYKNPSDIYDLEFENTITHLYKASNWSPSEVKVYNDECKKEKKYKFYFPCVIATNSMDINIQRRILGLDYLQYLTNTLQISEVEYCQKQWVNLPNIRYLDLDFYNIIACDGGLIVVKGGKNSKNVNDQPKNKSTIIITNPLTYEIRFLPPIPYKILQHKIARLVFYDSTRTTYRLIVIGVSHCEERIYDDDIQTIRSTQIALLVYCSIKESWVHFEHIFNASSPFRDLGYSTMVVYGCSIYYGGFQISLLKQDLLKPVIFYFNISNSRRQQLTIDFTRAGEIYCVKVVEPPKLVQIGFNTKLYAVSREAEFKEDSHTLFITEVVVNEDGTPTGSFKVLPQGIMPKDLYKLLFRRTNKIEGKLKMFDGKKLPPWEVMASIGHIAIKVIGFDSFIALYNVQDQNWNYTYFPCIETILEHPNTKGWRLIPGVYEPRWNATP